MLKHKLLFFVGFVSVLIFVGAASAKPQTQDAPERIPTVAVLVMDAFDLPDESATDDSNCVAAPGGQDGPVWGGASNLPPALIARLSLLLGSHGNAVFNTSTQWLAMRGLRRKQVVPNRSFPLPNMIRKMEYWGYRGSPEEILVIGVDTGNFKTSVVAANIDAVVDYFSKPIGGDKPNDAPVITQFVVNMSFAILPCSGIPYPSLQDYLNAIDRMVGASELKALLEGLADQPSEKELEEALGIYYPGLRVYLWLTKVAPELEDALQQAYAGVPSGVEDCNTFSNYIINHPVLGDPYLLGLFTAYQDLSLETEQGSFNPTFQNSVVSADLLIMPPAAAQDGTQPCYPSQFFPPPSSNEGESLNVTDQYNEVKSKYEGRGVRFIPIAAAGNGWRDEDGNPITPPPPPYAPAYWPSVVSVSAEYSRPAGCLSQYQINVVKAKQDLTNLMTGAATSISDAAINELVTALRDPLSNDGEVRLNGVLKLPTFAAVGRPSVANTVLGCLFGTSFAAPRLSADAGIYLLQQEPIPCAGSEGESNPPLDHPKFDNLTPADAATLYCAGFPS